MSLHGLVRRMAEVERNWFRDDMLHSPRRGVDISLRWVYLHMIEEDHPGRADRRLGERCQV